MLAVGEGNSHCEAIRLSVLALGRASLVTWNIASYHIEVETWTVASLFLLEGRSKLKLILIKLTELGAACRKRPEKGGSSAACSPHQVAGSTESSPWNRATGLSQGV